MRTKYAAFIVLMAVSVNLYGQNNSISFDPFLPFFGTVQAHYERNVWKRMSVELGLGRKFNSGIFELSGINANGVYLEDLNFEGIKILPEVRYYVSKNDKGINGFYTGIYFKYQTNHTTLTGTYTDKTGEVSNINLNMDIYSKTVGVEIGYKIPIYKNLFCDMIIAGTGLSKHKLILAESTKFSNDFYEKLDIAARYYSPLKDFNPDISLSAGTHTVEFPTIHFRYGFKIGVSF